MGELVDQAGDREDILISTDGISKKFCRNLRRSMYYGMQDLSRDLLGLRPRETQLRSHEFWALQDISFRLQRGDVLGLIGLNGSGKSTLLRLLCGIFPPDRGSISVRGRVSALIALGAGFHPNMSGRENVYLNGSILGIPMQELEEQFEAIVDFAELHDSIDAPVSTYSSGMRVRLGFAIATRIRPDILLIDEVLAVGDVRFRGKCYNLIKEIAAETATIFVTHQLPQVSMLCNKICVLDRGQVQYFGKDVGHGIELYLSGMEDASGTVGGSGKAVISDIEVNGPGEEKILFRDDVTVAFTLTLHSSVKAVEAGITFLTPDQRMVAQSRSLRDGMPIANRGEPIRVRARFRDLELCPGTYYLSIFAYDDETAELVGHYFSVKKIVVQGDFTAHTAIALRADWQLGEGRDEEAGT